MDCLAQPAALLQLVQDTHASKVLVDIGGSRSASALAAVLTALQRAGVPAIYVKCQALLQSALQHMLALEADTKDVDRVPHNEREAGCRHHVSAASYQHVTTACCASDTQECIQASEKQFSPQAALELASIHSAGRHPSRRSKRTKQQHAQPASVLWRWRQQAMPHAFDVDDAAQVMQAGLVHESLAVVQGAASWWHAQVLPLQ